MTDDERRAAARAPIELKVEYKRVNTFFADYTRNISRGGTFIRTDKPLEIGTEFVFALVVPHIGEPLRLKGQVQWVTRPDEAALPDKPAGMGIRFLYDAPEQRADVERLVERLMATELGEALTTKLLGKPLARSLRTAGRPLCRPRRRPRSARAPCRSTTDSR